MTERWLERHVLGVATSGSAEGLFDTTRGAAEVCSCCREANCLCCGAAGVLLVSAGVSLGGGGVLLRGGGGLFSGSHGLTLRVAQPAVCIPLAPHPRGFTTGGLRAATLPWNALGSSKGEAAAEALGVVLAALAAGMTRAPLASVAVFAFGTRGKMSK